MQRPLQDWLTWALSPTPSAIAVTLLISLLLPVLFHYFLYRQGESSQLPRFVLVGPSGAGKTALTTLFATGKATKTHTSQTPQTVDCVLPRHVKAASAQYRAQDDPSAKAESKWTVTDTPGHGKLRNHAMTALKESGVNGVIFVVDAAALSTPAGINEAAAYLYDVLLALQQRHTRNKSSKDPPPIAVLVAANKLDLFTALPTQLVRRQLQTEMTKIRESRAKGLMEVGDDDHDEEREWLGQGGDAAFDFGHMQESGVEVSVLGGNVTGANGEAADVDEWWKWIAAQV